MRSLEECRVDIDRINVELVRLFEERMNVVAEVAEYKRAHDLPVLDPVREKQVIEKCTQYLQNKDFSDALKQWLELTMKLSRDSEEIIKNRK